MVELYLCMLLRIVVRLVGVVAGVSLGIGVLACGVVAPVCTVESVGSVFVHTVPTHAGRLFAAEEPCEQ